MKQYNVLHIITGLSIGGAEMMLLNLLANKNYKDKFNIYVVSLRSGGELVPWIEQIGIKVKCLEMGQGWKNVLAPYQLVNIIKKFKPDLIQTWLYHADFIGGIIGSFFSECPIVWGIHNSFLDKDAKFSTKWIVKICARLSRSIPFKIISCSEYAKNIHLNIGYYDKFEYIPNGFDINIFKPNIKFRKKIRIELGIQENEILFGLIARFDPLKDHGNFFEAARLLSKKRPDCKFLLCGKNINWGNRNLVKFIEDLELEKIVYLLDCRKDIPQLMNALDFCVSSSKSEAFPMVLGEAMASGTPCIATDVGDSKKILGNFGFCVKSENAVALAEAMEKISCLPKSELGLLCENVRMYIEENYSMDVIANKYSVFHRDCIEKFHCTNN